MRQDLTVQHLRGPLAVQVYEAAARAALEYGDLPEYNQCQAQLGGLYADNPGGCRGEFLAYRLLYQVAHAGQSGGAAALMTTLRLVSAEVSCTPVSRCCCTRLRGPQPGFESCLPKSDRADAVVALWSCASLLEACQHPAVP